VRYRGARTLAVWDARLTVAAPIPPRSAVSRTSAFSGPLSAFNPAPPAFARLSVKYTPYSSPTFARFPFPPGHLLDQPEGGFLRPHPASGSSGGAPRSDNNSGAGQRQCTDFLQAKRRVQVTAPASG
jgi:hypothetical protein